MDRVAWRGPLDRARWNIAFDLGEILSGLEDWIEMLGEVAVSDADNSGDRAEEELTTAYSRTVITDDAGRVLVGGQQVDPLPCPAVCHVVTAYNPRSIPQAEELNLRDQSLMMDELRARGIESHRVTGTSPDVLWSEPSLLFGGQDRALALELGRMFGQVAVFELDEERVRVIACDSGRVLYDGSRMRSGEG